MVSSRLTFYASLTSEGRCRLAPPIIDDGAVGKAAMRFQVSAATASRSTRRYGAGQLLIDRSSRPRSSPAQRSACEQLRIVSLHLAVSSIGFASTGNQAFDGRGGRAPATGATAAPSRSNHRTAGAPSTTRSNFQASWCTSISRSGARSRRRRLADTRPAAREA